MNIDDIEIHYDILKIGSQEFNLVKMSELFRIIDVLVDNNIIDTIRGLQFKVGFTNLHSEGKFPTLENVGYFLSKVKKEFERKNESGSLAQSVVAADF